MTERNSAGSQPGRRRVIALVLAAGLAATALGASPAAAARVAAPATATAPPSAALQSAVDRLVAQGVPGVIAFERRGGRVSHAVAGVSDVATGRPIRPGDRFRIASNTKSFVSAVVLQLVGERRLRLSDTVQRWLPGRVPGGARITVRQLLGHTSGIYNYTDDERIFAPYLDRDWAHYWSPDQLLDVAVSHPPLFRPGAQFSYSNTNYVVLGMIVRAVTARDPVGEVYRRIVRPLGLRHTTFPTRDPGLPAPYVHGYYVLPELGGPDPIDVSALSPSWAWTAGGIVSTVDDLATFHRALVTGRLLGPAEQRELLAIAPVARDAGYALGLARAETPCGVVWGHNGGFPGYLSSSFVSRDGQRQVVLVINLDGDIPEQIRQDTSAAVLTALCGGV